MYDDFPKRPSNPCARERHLRLALAVVVPRPEGPPEHKVATSRPARAGRAKVGVHRGGRVAGMTRRGYKCNAWLDNQNRIVNRQRQGARPHLANNTGGVGHSHEHQEELPSRAVACNANALMRAVRVGVGTEEAVVDP